MVLLCVVLLHVIIVSVITDSDVGRNQGVGTWEKGGLRLHGRQEKEDKEVGCARLRMVEEMQHKKLLHKIF